MKLSIFLLLFIAPLCCLAESNSVLINEIAWMGTTASANDEWLELYNPTDSEIDLTGWRLEAADGAPAITLAGTIPAGGYFLLERTDDDTVPAISADQIYTGSLGNDGEELKLYDQNNTVIDQISGAGGWPGGENETKKTLERKDAASWQTSAEPGGTPKAANSQSGGDDGGGETEETAEAPESDLGSSQPDLPGIGRGDIAISEIFPDPAGVDNEKEFIELKNISGNTLDLAGAKISNSSGQEYVFPSVILFPANIAVFSREKTGLILVNDKDKIILYSAAGKIIDQKSYDSSRTGLSCQRTADNKWCWAEITPGGETICEPEVFPLPKISGPKTAAVGEILIFDASDSFDPKNRPLNFHWDFGDGKTANGIIVYQIFTKAGTFEISLTAAATALASSTVKYKIKIAGDAELPAIAATTTVQAATIAPAAIYGPPIYQNYDSIKIFISEFLPNPDKNLSQEEFIELANAEEFVIDLSGWQLTDSGRGKFVIPAGTIIRPGQPLVLFAKQTKIALNNDGDEINLIAPAGQVIDSAKYATSKKSVSYILDEDLEWRESQLPTPGEINVLPAAEENQATATITPKILGADLAATSTTSSEVMPPEPKKYWRYLLAGFFGAAALAAVLYQRRQKSTH